MPYTAAALKFCYRYGCVDKYHPAENYTGTLLHDRACKTPGHFYNKGRKLTPADVKVMFARSATGRQDELSFALVSTPALTGKLAGIHGYVGPQVENSISGSVQLEPLVSEQGLVAVKVWVGDKDVGDSTFVQTKINGDLATLTSQTPVFASVSLMRANAKPGYSGRRKLELVVRELWIGCTPPPSHLVLNAAPGAAAAAAGAAAAAAAAGAAPAFAVPAPAPAPVGSAEIAAMQTQLEALGAKVTRLEARVETAEHIVLQLTGFDADEPAAKRAKGE
jgi:hypothetical protein